MNIRPIRTEADHDATLAESSTLMAADPEFGTVKGDLLAVLATLVQAFEARHCPMAPVGPAEAIKFRMDQQGPVPRDLEPKIGWLNRVYEMLSRKRPLTMAMAWRLHTQRGIPAALTPALVSPRTPGADRYLGSS